MGKYTAKKANKSRKRLISAIIILSLITGLLIWVAVLLEENTIPELLQSAEPTEPLQATPSEATAPSEPETKPQSFEPVVLGEGLEIVLMGSYAGIYMEDGTDDIVSDVMMIVLKNTSDADLQLARVDLVYGEFTAEFEVTNLPAGKSAVLLEKNRKPYSKLNFEEAKIRNVVFFSDPMTLSEDKVAITASKGSISLTNISETDISGTIYIYYKNSASDLLYGGITYRVRIEGLGAGETASVIAGHYNPDTSSILSIVCSE